MKIKSFIQEHNRLIPIEVELTLMPGLPQIHFLGLPDQSIKESTHRIKSAIKNQGFEFPTTQQILVNLSPAHLRKRSQGLDLAVAAALLWETEQIEKPMDLENMYLYGALDLSGEVIEPEDADFISETPEDAIILTGRSEKLHRHFFQKQMIESLNQISQPSICEATHDFELKRPQKGLELFYSQAQAKLIQIIALGEHSILLAGASGSGKTTLAEALPSFLQEPERDDFIESFRISKTFGYHLDWRPIVKPHHSITPLAMIGGGASLWCGEITRAHNGVLIIDELLEFNPKIQEALREPFQEGKIQIARGGKARTFPAQSLIVATTNLCPCGDFVPGCKVSCRYSLSRCKSYSQRLSGPIVDRFQMLSFSNEWSQSLQVSGEEILASLEKVRSHRACKIPNSRAPLDELASRMDSFVYKNILPDFGHSKRRLESTIRVAATIADLEFSQKIEIQHINQAICYTHRPFEKIRRWD